jgi:hypothetical protein
VTQIIAVLNGHPVYFINCAQLFREFANHQKGLVGLKNFPSKRYLNKLLLHCRAPTLVKSDFQLFLLQIPSRKLIGKDRVAVVAKQLNDFIYLYNRETDLYSEGGDKPNIVPNKLYQPFLAAAK